MVCMLKTVAALNELGLQSMGRNVLVFANAIQNRALNNVYLKTSSRSATC